MDPGQSLFNPSEIIHLNADDHGQEEYDDDVEEQKRKEKELQELLHTEFDDLIDDDESNASIAEQHEQPQLDNGYDDRRDLLQWPYRKAHETSTPKNILPNWTGNYTPINGNHLTSRLRFMNKENGTDRILAHVPEENDFDARDTFPKIPHQNGSTENPPLLNGVHHEESPPSLGFKNHQQYAQDLVMLKETMMQQQDEHNKEIRKLTHELKIAKGDQESLVFSLQQARQLLADKEQQLFDIQKQMQRVEKEIEKEKKCNNEMLTEQKTLQSLLDAKNRELADINSFEAYSYLRSKNENILKQAETRHNQEMERSQMEMKEKDSLIKKLKLQVQELENYQERTMPEKLRGINQLSHNLESVEKYCQKLLSTEAFKDAEQLSRDETAVKDHQDQITRLLAAVSDLDAKLQRKNEQNDIPVVAHTKALEKVEREKYDLQRKYESLVQDLKDLQQKNKDLFTRNQQLTATMETMIKKHDMDIKSSIEKYHSLHSKETKLMKDELADATNEEKYKLREFYEEKLSSAYKDVENLTTRLNEAQELYVKVCQEKNRIESERNPNGAANNLLIQRELQKAYAEMERDLKNSLRNEFEVEMKRTEEQWALNKAQEINLAIKEYENSLAINEAELRKELDKRTVDLTSTRNMLRETESLYNESARKLKESESVVEDVQSKLRKAETALKEMQNHFESTQNMFASQISNQQEDFNERLNFINQQNEREIDSIIEKVEKAMDEEKKRIVSKGNEIISKLNEEIRNLKSQLQAVTQKHLVDFSCLASLPTEKENVLFDELKKSTKYIAQLEKEVSRIENAAKTCKTTESQTIHKMVPLENVVKLQKFYKGVILELEDELKNICTSSSLKAAKMLHNAILEYHKQFSK